MEAEHSQAIISWIQKEFETALFCCYEQIKPNDPFGKMMIQNLEVNIIFLLFNNNL